MTRTRVVVTGLGTTSPVGGDVPSTWDALVNGRSGVRYLDDDWAEELPVRIAGRIAVEPTEVLERVKARRLDRSSQFAMVAAMEAWADAGLADGAGPARQRAGRRRDGLRHRRRHDAARQLRHAQGEGAAPGLPARGPDADAQRAGGPDQPVRRRAGRGEHPGVRVRVRQRGDRAGRRPDPARPGRRRASPAAPRRRSTRCRWPRSPT